MNVTTSATLLELNDLAPYTIYTVFVSVTNIYREVEGLDPLACSPTMFQTSAGGKSINLIGSQVYDEKVD